MASVVLLSGGLDSTVLLAERINAGDNPIAISFDYGQTHRAKELAAARRIAAHYKAEHRIIGMASVVLPSALTGVTEIPEGHADSPDATTVPARNMILLSIGAAVAEASGGGTVYFGANRDDNAGYVDCRPDFVAAMNCAATQGTNTGVEIQAPFLHLTKRDIVHLGRRIGAPIELSWSCYRGGETPCDVCGACVSRNEATQ